MLLEIRDLCGGYGGRDVIRGVSCRADGGEVLCLVGPNGCGKTTLFRLLLGTLPIRSGSVRIDGAEISALSPRALANLAAYIPQSHRPVFAYTALEVVMMGRASHFPAFEAPRAVDREAAFAALEKMDAAHLANRDYAALSGGQRQMILIARAICQDAKVFLMDEPSASLDYANHRRLMDVVGELAQRGYCIVLSTHSPEDPFSVGDRALLLREGRAEAFGRPRDVITPQTLEAVYGMEMDVLTVRDRYGAARTICLPVKKP